METKPSTVSKGDRHAAERVALAQSIHQGNEARIPGYLGNKCPAADFLVAAFAQFGLGNELADIVAAER